MQQMDGHHRLAARRLQPLGGCGCFCGGGAAKSSGLHGRPPERHRDGLEERRLSRASVESVLDDLRPRLQHAPGPSVIAAGVFPSTARHVPASLLLPP